ncbi:hypothetical protein [Paenarthrobacter nitroguajacolicus]|uniref:hypothetical protein n=1 Tax=Paenarthrobacter nitroguajacolicus TaxID=211146 RepID=UPI004053B8AC
MGTLYTLARYSQLHHRYAAVVGWAKTHLWDFPDGPALAGHYLAGVTVLPDFRRRSLAVSGARPQA